MKGKDEAQVLWQRAQATIAQTELQRGSPSTSPVARYLDPERHVREVAALRRLPHAVGPARVWPQRATG